MRMKSFTGAATASLLLWMSCATATADGPSGSRVLSRDELLAVTNGYRANLQAFSQFTCEYTLRVGVAASEADAIAGRIAASDEELAKAKPSELTGGSVCAHCIWIQDGAKRRFEENVPNFEDLAKQIKSRQINSVCATSGRELTDGEVGIHFNLIMSSGAVFDAAYPFEREIGYPFDYAVPNVRSGLLEIMEKTLTTTRLEVTTPVPNGKPSQDGLRLDWRRKDHSPPAPNTFSTSWILDPQQGFVAREIAHSRVDGSPVDKAVVTEVEHVANAGWLPIRSLYLTGLGQPGQKTRITVRELRVDRYHVGRPSSAAFAIDLPADGILHYGMDRNSQFPFETAKRVDFKTIRELLDTTHRVSKAATLRIALAPALPIRGRATSRDNRAATSPSRSIWILVIANIVLLTIVVGLLVRRRYRRR
jgi:hypothetical protein